MIYVIGNPTEPSAEYQADRWRHLIEWLLPKTEIEFDIETTVSPWWCEKKVITVQFGDDQDQWVIQWSECQDMHKAWIRERLEDNNLLKLIHNALFECTVLLFHGIRVQNVYDTMLAEMVLQGGEHTVGYGLDDICLKRLDVVLDKSQQLLFGDNILTPEKVVYAAQDVKHLSALRESIKLEASAKSYETFDKVVELENSIVPAFAEMVYHGMEVDKEWWIGLAREAEPLVSAAQEKLNSWLQQEPFRTVAYQLNYLSDEDRVLINWNSPKQKEQLFKDLFPELPGTSKAVLKKWQSTQLKAQQAVPDWLPYYLDGDCSEVAKVVVNEHRDYLIAEQQLIPAGTPTINWNSTDQVLPLMQTVEPRLKGLSAEEKGRTAHPSITDLDDYLDSTKLLSTYGESFIYGTEKKLPKIEPDGHVRTNFKQVLTTGRISSAGPNMQNIPAKESVGNKYRNAFVAPRGWSFVSSDYASQELVVIAYLSKDPVWAEVLTKGQDLHSAAAEQVFGKKWKNAASPDCAYYHVEMVDGKKEYAKQKCKCPGHKPMRTGTKTVDFGLAFGMSEFKLASTLHISVPEAKQIIVDYFIAFPGIGKMLEYLGDFGVKNGYIQTVWPYYRRRFFPNWQFYTRFIDSHLSGAQYHPGLGEVQRASKNQPIQGTAADMMKVAIGKVYNHIHNNNLSDKVHMVMQVHDQLDCVVRDDFKDEWAPVQTKLLEDAAKVFIPTGILKAETTITLRWQK